MCFLLLVVPQTSYTSLLVLERPFGQDKYFVIQKNANTEIKTAERDKHTGKYFLNSELNPQGFYLICHLHKYGTKKTFQSR